MKRLAAAAILAAAAWIWRAKLVAVLTATTGTWVGSPPPLRSPATPPAARAAASRSSAGASSLAPDDGRTPQ